MSTEILTVSTGEFREGFPLLVGPRVLHCMAAINATHVFMVGGIDQQDNLFEVKIESAKSDK